MGQNKNHAFPDFCSRPIEWDSPLYFYRVVSSIFFLLFFLSSPNLSGRRVDVYHRPTSTHGVALVRI